jgi:hypothetical protein
VWAFVAFLVSNAAIVGHAAAWWWKGGVTYTYAGDLNAWRGLLTSLHAFALVMSAVFVTIGLCQRTRNRWFTWLTLLWAGVVFLGGMIFLARGWKHYIITPSCGWIFPSALLFLVSLVVARRRGVAGQGQAEPGATNDEAE